MVNNLFALKNNGEDLISFNPLDQNLNYQSFYRLLIICIYYENLSWGSWYAHQDFTLRKKLSLRKW
jgi:hypothetical protein